MSKNTIAGKKSKKKNSNYKYQPSAQEVQQEKKSRVWLILAVCLLVAAALTVIIISAVNSKKSETTAAPAASSAVSSENLHHVEIEIADYGTVKAELYSDIAPISVENFLSLAESGFYNGLTFHRIMDGFMIQGGDPTGTGYNGSDKTIKGEFASNGVENNLSHTRGVLSMARSNDPNSASSQFFIVQTDSTFLDGNYAAFGMVTEGMEFVDQICKDTPVQDNNGTVLAADQPVITAIRVID